MQDATAAAPALAAIRALCDQGRIDLMEANLRLVALEDLARSNTEYQQAAQDLGGRPLPPLSQLPSRRRGAVLNAAIKAASQNTCQVGKG